MRIIIDLLSIVRGYGLLLFIKIRINKKNKKVDF
jgi:hypothetical protein